MSWRGTLAALGARPFGGNSDYSPVSRMDLEAVVKRAGAVSLPQAYVDFVTTMGGAGFPRAVVITTPSGQDAEVFGLQGNEGPSLVFRHDVLSTEYQFPAYLIPIADDGMSQPFFLDAREGQGQVYYAEVETGDGELKLVASSFEDFVERLRLRESR